MTYEFSLSADHIVLPVQSAGNAGRDGAISSGTYSIPLCVGSSSLAAGNNPGGVTTPRATGASLHQPIRGAGRFVKLQNLGRPKVRFRVGAALQPSEQPRGRLSNRLYRRVLSLLRSHDENSNEGANGCPSKEFPKTENVFPRLT